jgi:serine/threonine-protein kinase
MRFCAACDKTYGDDVEWCPVHRSAMRLVADSENETLPVAITALAAGGGGATPLPSVSASGRAAAAGASIDDALVGNILADRYEVTRKVGQGGMGAVYEAKHLLIGKRVAVKVLLDKYARREDVVARLRQEARLASSIGHENIVDITDIGETHDGRTFVVMEFLDGESLAQLLAREGALPPARAITIVRQVASALGAAHAKGIVHRDIKPENVFIVRRSERDFAKVVDFGISKALRVVDDEEGASSPRLTHTGMVLGTPLYMSPEQARGEDDLDERIDVYALGVILYELLTGETPFRGSNYLNVIAQVLSQDPRPPSEVRPDLQLSPAVESVVVRAMAKDREARYRSMAELDGDLLRLERGEEAVLAGAAALSQLATRATRTRGQLATWIIGLLLLAGATVALVLTLTAEDPPTRPPPAPEAKQVAVPPPLTVPVIPPAPPERPIAKVEVAVDSEPAGAEVYWGAVKLGTTPTRLAFNKNDETITLTLKLAGHADAPVPFQPDRDLELPRIKLVKLRPAPPVQKPGVRSGGSLGPASGNGEIMFSPYGEKTPGADHRPRPRPGQP